MKGDIDKLRGCCGLDCSTCDIHLAPRDRRIAEKLVAHYKSRDRKEASVDWFQCEGCKGSRKVHWSPDCAILKCCLDQRRLNDCSECSDFPCPLTDAFEDDGHRHHRKTIENLKKLKEDRGQD